MVRRPWTASTKTIQNPIESRHHRSQSSPGPPNLHDSRTSTNGTPIANSKGIRNRRFANFQTSPRLSRAAACVARAEVHTALVSRAATLCAYVAATSTTTTTWSTASSRPPVTSYSAVEPPAAFAASPHRQLGPVAFRRSRRRAYHGIALQLGLHVCCACAEPPARE